MAIPDSMLPGHRALHDKVVSALGLCQETQRIEFKESARWNTLKYKLVKSVLGMGNLRDGGITVIGVSERNGTWQLTGITNDDLQTYDVDPMLGHFSGFVSPFAELDIVRVTYDGREFLAVQTREFQEIPLVCKRNGPDPNDEGLYEGGIYTRPTGVPRTTRVMDAQQMRDLLQLAAEKKAREILRQARGIGMVAPETDDTAFDRELEDL